MKQEVGQSLDEVFDIVDDQDRVIGQGLRGQIHRDGLKHRAVHLFWSRENGQMCWQRRSFAKDNCPGLLSSACAGHVDAGETYEQAAYRELHEELGVQLAPGSLVEIDYVPAHPDLGWEFVRCYWFRGTYSVSLAAYEVDSILWRTPQEVEAWAQAQPDIFSTPVLHLLQRPAVRRALGLGE
jgi:16S rRNA (adenine1518-N6/adenine1519-N6)-dimethyltransferase